MEKFIVSVHLEFDNREIKVAIIMKNNLMNYEKKKKNYIGIYTKGNCLVNVYRYRN